MFLQEKIIIGDTEKAFLYKDKKFIKILDAGIHEFWSWQNYTHTPIFIPKDELYHDKQILNLINLYPEQFSKHTATIKTNAKELALIYFDDRLIDILMPAKEAYYWLNNKDIKIEKIALSATTLAISDAIYDQLRKTNIPKLVEAKHSWIYEFIVPDQHIGFLLCNQKKIATLGAGNYAFWNAIDNFSSYTIDCRLQNIEVSGQEILTKDKVSIRINLLATWQIVDASTLIESVIDSRDFVYKELQLALRTVIATRTLDELLADKNALNQEIKEIVQNAMQNYGITLNSTGVKDIILPGDMKNILTQVVEAQKIADANIIKRREETQATRSLLNTAKVMENNPVLLRLKELETLEKITAKVGNLNVYGGLDGVMNNLVKLTDTVK